ncbi:potassium channel family protein [Enhygromyxa salina]|nr:potassium channel family protein [Enhygromyxa salina]
MSEEIDNERPALSHERRESGWAKVLRGLEYTNNLLLLPMFTVLIIEASVRDSTDVFASVNEFFCAMFFAEWALGLALADDRWAYLRSPSNLADLASSIPVSALAQGLRVVRLLRLLRVIRLVSRIRRFQGKGATMVRAFGLFGALVITGALAFRIVEPHSTESLEHALWWSLVTLSTVGYGDVTPATPAGHVVAVFVIVAGIGIFGYMAGFMTSLIEDPEEDEILAIVQRLEVQVGELRATLEAEPRRPA